MYSLLIVEDSFDVKESVKEYFSSFGNNEYKLDFSTNLIEGNNMIRTNKYDLVVIDFRLVKHSDNELAKRFIEHCFCHPVISILDVNDEDEMEIAYSMSLDSLILRPFTASDFYESVDDFFEERKKEKVNPNLECCGIKMNSVTELVMVDGKQVDISDKASEVLRVLLENKEQVVSRDVLLKKVWGDGYQGRERVLDSQIKILRKQLGSKGSLIRTVKGQGYIIGGK